ncbi:hypothetical protein LTR84_000950 [Exophiala bonariae]|uniref:F-box domain-containing protein n=1 Tax=Exophiala bonariae TaxID=1690606 RepID=A0AAV9NS13_9EURO|nr:hypothetical protein LTR84_000950 [Exophiala bonariae]
MASDSNLTIATIEDFSSVDMARLSLKGTPCYNSESQIRGEEHPQEEQADQIPPIFSLPRELIGNIQSYLQYYDLKSLRSVSKAGSEAILPEDIKKSRLELRAKLWAAEKAKFAEVQSNEGPFDKWGGRWYSTQRKYNGSKGGYFGIYDLLPFTCYSCFEQLSISHFSDSQSLGRRAYGHEDARMRFCTTCAIEKSIWRPGERVRISHKLRIFCKGCKTLQKGDPDYRKFGFCSKKCQDETNGLWQSATELDPFLNRAARCLACWITDHTVRPVEGGLRTLCPECGAKEGLVLSSPT